MGAPRAGPASDEGKARATLYLGRGVDAGLFEALAPELCLDVRELCRPAEVDVKTPRVFVLDEASSGDRALTQAVARLHGDQAAIIMLGPPAREPLALHDGLGAEVSPFACLDAPVSQRALRHALASALRQIAVHERVRREQLELDRRAGQLADLHHVGVALSAVHNTDALQTLILSKARDITAADAGSLYLVVEDDQEVLDAAGRPLLDPDGKPVRQRVKALSFNKGQNFSQPIAFTPFRLPLDAGLAGYVATTGNVVQHQDVADLPAGAAYSLAADPHAQAGYRCKSMLVVPMANSKSEIIGVIQLVNRKYRADVKLTPENLDAEVLPFALEDRDLTLSFASQAAVALDNRRLIESIQNLFEGFVTASVQAIESRDPTTSGHSGRVATLSVGLAEAVNATRASSLAALRFGPEAMRELRYAALLHDFGKVGVREQVLIKAKKLYEWQVDQIQSRFALARAALEAGFARRKLDYVLAHGAGGSERALAALDDEQASQVERLAAAFQLVLEANEPAVLAGEALDSLLDLATLSYDAADGRELLLRPAELRKLSIARGSLDADERLEIESHVSHTYRFLTKIPWTRELRQVPEIAWAHHERLNGSGYPNHFTADQIPVQSKMMAIADIYDALTAWDRPYKKAVPVDRALDILRMEARDGHVDALLLDVFIERGVYRLTARDEA